MKTEHIPSVEDHLVRDIVRGIADAELSASTLAASEDDRLPGRIHRMLSALRETIAVASVRAEQIAFETDVPIEWARTPDEPEIDPYEGWLDYGIVIDGAEINVRTSSEDAERLVAFLGKAEEDRDLDQELKRAQLEVAKAKLADRKPIKGAWTLVDDTMVTAFVENGAIVLETKIKGKPIEVVAPRGDRGPTGYPGPIGVKGAVGD